MKKVSVLRFALVLVAFLSFCGVAAEEAPGKEVEETTFLIEKLVCLALMGAAMWGIGKVEKHFANKNT